MPAPSTVALSDYRATLNRLLHDPSDVLWSQADKNAYINEAIQRRDLDTGGRRLLGVFTLTADQDTYDFTALSAATGLGTANIFDIISITLLYTGVRVVLDQRTLTDLNTWERAYINTSQWPTAWARYGDRRIVLAPPPSIAYQVELDCLVYSNPATLVADTDTDSLQFPYTYPVPYYAAHLAKLNERQYDEADWFLDRYQHGINNINAVKAGMVPSAYPGGSGR